MEELKSLAALRVDPKIKKDLGDIIDELKGYPFVHAIILFGSCARDEMKPLSDIDICVIAEKNLSFDEKANIGSYSSDKIDISIFWDLPLIIQFRVFKEGKLLYCNDNEALHRIKVETIRKYLDFKHIIDRHVKRTFTGV